MHEFQPKYLMLNEISASLTGESLGTMLYGSVARGTQRPKSDIDVLQLSNTKRWPYQRGKINVSVYTPDFLSKLAKEGSLFVLHLRRDGETIEDKDSLIKKCLDCYTSPTTYEPFRKKLRSSVGLLDIEESSYTNNWRSFGRLSLFFLRSTLFADFAESGNPTFCLHSIADSTGDQRLRDAYAIKHSNEPDWHLFKTVCNLVEEYLRCEIFNPFGNTEELLLQRKENDLLVSLGLRLVRRYKPVDYYAAFRDRILSSRTRKP